MGATRGQSEAAPRLARVAGVVRRASWRFATQTGFRSQSRLRRGIGMKSRWSMDCWIRASWRSFRLESSLIVPTTVNPFGGSFMSSVESRCFLLDVGPTEDEYERSTAERFALIAIDG